jgi:hypothetical protein
MHALCLFLLAAATAPAGVRERSVVIEKPEAEYTIEVAGAVDPENIEIRIENLGDTPVVSPRISISGLYDWYDVNAIVAEATAGCETDEEKALGIWWWILHKRFQREPGDGSALHPVRALNGYGYGICGHSSAWMKCLLTAAGIQARVWELSGHTISEAFWGGAWHMLDANVKVFYLDRDNRSIAPLATLEKDPWLIERTIHPRDPWLRGADPPGRNREFVNYIVTGKDNWENRGYDAEWRKPYTMAMTLKPGETLARWWKPVLGKFAGRDKRAEVPERYANGQLSWEPDLARIDMRPYIRTGATGNTATRAEDGRWPAIHIAELQDRLYTRASRFTVPIDSPYPIVGGRAWCTLVKEGNSARDQANIFFGEPGLDAGDLYTYRWERGRKEVELDLDPSIMRAGPIYRYVLGFNMRGNADADPPTQAGLDAIKVVTDLQVSPHSLPALAKGRNVVKVRHESKGPVRLRITHRWREITDREPPPRVAGGRLAEGGLEPVLEWGAALGAADYQVMVSPRPDCRWPLSPSLFRNMGSTATQWKVPATFLEPAAQYYWKVRPRNAQGDMGEWSEVFQFRTPPR